MIPFVKMHGCGNDFVVVREAELSPLPFGLDELARRVCDRHYGVGADGLLVYRTRTAGVPPRVQMRYWNADGSAAEMCGNGARCVVRDAVERDSVATPLVLETDVGEHTADVERENGVVTRVALSMGPATSPDDFAPRPVRVGDATLAVSSVSMGNPHAIVFVEDRGALERVPLATLGRGLAEHPAFPAGANASFVAIRGGSELFLRVWERGAGATLACGTASCAALATALRLGKLESPRARVHLPGGVVEAWREDCGTLWLAGPAAYVARGTLEPELLAPRSDAPQRPVPS